MLDVEFDDRRVDLVRDGFDLALRGGTLEDSSIVSRHVCNLLTVLVASPAYLERHGPPRNPDDLARHRLVAVRFLNGTVSRWSFKRPKGQPEERKPEPATIVVSDPQAAVGAAVLGMGIAQTGVHHAWEHLKAGRLKLVLARQHHSGRRSMALQYPHRALVAPRVRITVDFLLAELVKIKALHVTLDKVQQYGA